MTDVELDGIRQRYANLKSMADVAALADEAVPKLLAEVYRLRAIEKDQALDIKEIMEDVAIDIANEREACACIVDNERRRLECESHADHPDLPPGWLEDTHTGTVCSYLFAMAKAIRARSTLPQETPI